VERAAADGTSRVTDTAHELQVLRDVAARLERAGFDYMLTGSLAMSYYATPRMTRDIDLVVALRGEDARRLASIFADDYYVPDNIAEAMVMPGMFNLVHVELVVKVDIVVRKDEPYRRHEFERRRRIDLGGFEGWIVSREDLILSKLLWIRESGSEQQQRDVRQLLGRDADMAYLAHWAPILGVSDWLERSSP
jgi:hypothetical protein